ncbi:MAG TPA: inositol monophosphatase, partial [Sedimentisphaerales bacterium]|nr:inositol monophosphatase [Sedimentisphaerales bacterium]
EELTYVRTSVKNATDIVTQADNICQKIIIDYVKTCYPDHGFIAEEGSEGKLLKTFPRGDDQFWWIIDPIDGTNNYAHRVLSFTVSVAVLCKGFPVVGVIFDPATESTWTAVKSEVPRLNGAEIAASTAAISRFESFAIDNNFENIDRFPQGVASLMLRTRFRNMGTTALHMAYVASAGFIGMLNATPKLWDIAAGAFIAECAGAKVSDFKGNPIWPVNPATYSGGNCPVLAAAPNAYREAMDAMKDYPA